jgi:hypothetical protein
MPKAKPTPTSRWRVNPFERPSGQSSKKIARSSGAAASSGLKRKRDPFEASKPTSSRPRVEQPAVLDRPVAYNLRGRKVHQTTILQEGRSFRDTRRFFYPSSVGKRPVEKRKAMGADVTNDLVARGPKDPFTPSIARSVAPLTEGGKATLKEHKASRNHILADSRIRVILESIASGDKANDVQANCPKRRDLERFFVVLNGPKRGRDLFNRYMASMNHGLEVRAGIIHEAALGRENLRFGHADINTVVSNEFDPVVVDGRLDPRSMEIRDAVIALGANGLVDSRTVLDALEVTQDKFTHQDVTSSVLESRSINERTGSRTVIDPFAGPANPVRMKRARSIDFGQLLDRPAVMENAREFHYTSRPAFLKID